MVRLYQNVKIPFGPGAMQYTVQGNIHRGIIDVITLMQILTTLYNRTECKNFCSYLILSEWSDFSTSGVPVTNAVLNGRAIGR